MKIRLISDIHQEFYEDTQLYKPQGEDVLVLLGDLHTGAHQVTKTLRKFREKSQATILYIPGNHEYYGTTIDAFDVAIGLSTRDLGIYLLNPGMVRVGGVTFIGAALWTNFRRDPLAELVCGRGINDFRRINGFGTDKCAQLHETHIEYIQREVAAAEGPCVICTHFLPAVECIAPEYRNEGLVNNYFANDYGQWISELKDTTWLFGHTHSNVDITIGSTRLIANPYGYNRNLNYTERIIEL